MPTLETMLRENLPMTAGVTAGAWAGEGSLLKAGRWRYDGLAARNTRIACVPRHT